MCIVLCCELSDDFVLFCTTDETDYTPLVDVLLTFNTATRRQCFNVRITNDILVEGSEEFSLLLLEDPFVPPPTQTVFNASLATVTILDQDGKLNEFDQILVCLLLYVCRFIQRL